MTPVKPAIPQEAAPVTMITPRVHWIPSIIFCSFSMATTSSTTSITIDPVSAVLRKINNSRPSLTRLARIIESRTRSTTQSLLTDKHKEGGVYGRGEGQDEGRMKSNASNSSGGGSRRRQRVGDDSSSNLRLLRPPGKNIFNDDDDDNGEEDEGEENIEGNYGGERIPLIGLDSQRDDVLRFLSDVTESAESGNSLLIVGAHGAGKTSLIERCLQQKLILSTRKTSSNSRHRNIINSFGGISSTSTSSASAVTSFTSFGQDHHYQQQQEDGQQPFSLVHLDGKLILNDISALREISSQLALRPFDEALEGVVGGGNGGGDKIMSSSMMNESSEKNEVIEGEVEEEEEEDKADKALKMMHPTTSKTISQRAIEALLPMRRKHLMEAKAAEEEGGGDGNEARFSKKRRFVTTLLSSSSSSSSSSSASSSAVGEGGRLRRSNRFSTGGLVDISDDLSSNLTSTRTIRDGDGLSSSSAMMFDPLLERTIIKVLSDEAGLNKNNQSRSHHHHHSSSSPNLSYEQYLDFIVLTLRTRQTSVMRMKKYDQQQQQQQMQSYDDHGQYQGNNDQLSRSLSSSRPVFIVIDNFDLFARRTRQSLLYSLLDLIQSTHVHIAVIGLTTRTDCVDLLEKRLKSRFSARQVVLGSLDPLSAATLLRECLSLPLSFKRHSPHLFTQWRARADTLTNDPRIIEFALRGLRGGKGAGWIMSWISMALSRLSSSQLPSVDLLLWRPIPLNLMAPLSEDRSHETLSTIELLLLGALTRAAVIAEQQDYQDANNSRNSLVIDGEEIHPTVSSLNHHRGSSGKLRFGDAYNVLKTWTKNKDNESHTIGSGSGISASSASASISSTTGGITENISSVKNISGASNMMMQSTSAAAATSTSTSSRNVLPSNIRWQIEEGTALRALESLIQYDLVRIISSSSSLSLSEASTSSSSSLRNTQGGGGGGNAGSSGQYWKGSSSTGEHRSGGGGGALLSTFPIQTLLEAEVNRELLRWSPLSVNRDACHDVLSRAKDNASLPTELRRFLSQASSAAASSS